MIKRGLQNALLFFPLEVSDASFGKSIHHFISSDTLRMINSLESSYSMNWNASSASRTEVNSGKSIHHSPFNPFTLKHDTRTIIECKLTKEK